MKFAVLAVWIALHGGSWSYIDPVHQQGVRMKLLRDDQYMIPRWSIMVKKTYYGPIDDDHPLKDFPWIRKTVSWMEP